MTKRDQTIYFWYLAEQLALKHDFEVVDTSKQEWHRGRGTPDKQVGNTAIYFLWKNVKVRTFAELQQGTWPYNWTCVKLQYKERNRERDRKRVYDNWYEQYAYKELLKARMKDHFLRNPQTLPNMVEVCYPKDKLMMILPEDDYYQWLCGKSRTKLDSCTHKPYIRPPK